MSKQRAVSRSSEEWMSLITKCRQSGLSDAVWCEQNGIPASSFYNAVCRLRRKACEIPEPVNKAAVLDFTASHQDVIRIAIEPETAPTNVFPVEESPSIHLDNSHTIEIEMNGIIIKMNNSVHPILLEKILMTLEAGLC